MCHAVEALAMGESTRLSLTKLEIEVEAWITNGG
jgi:hypothetical protein